MKPIVAQIIFGLSLVTVIHADDQGVSVPWKLAGFERGFAMAQASYLVDQRNVQGAPDSDKKEKESRDQFNAKATQLFTNALALAQSSANSDDAFAALEWILTHEDAYYFPVGGTALKLVTEHHADNARIGVLIANLSYSIPRETNVHEAALKLIKVVAKTNPDQTARGQALLGLADIAREEVVLAEARGNPEVNRLRSVAEEAYKLVQQNYGNCRYLRTSGGRAPRKTLGEQAALALFDLNRLREGQVAPEIEAKDLAGVQFKLSDHRGKVVLLVFWASWCGPCMAAVPHEKKLVERFKGRPFVLIGVNGDSVKAAEVAQKHGIPWRSFWNEGQASGEPISVTWNIHGWPTVYVLDHAGVIRHKYLRDAKLDDALERLVSVAEASQAGSK
jgi:peroxiredoxin